MAIVVPLSIVCASSLACFPLPSLLLELELSCEFYQMVRL
jgi:hypothetical protein